MIRSDVVRAALAIAPTATLAATLAAAALSPGAHAQGASPNSPVPFGGVEAGPGEATIVSRDVSVRADETVLSIARRELGSAAFARPLAEFNGIDDPNAVLVPGDIVRVPIHVPARGETARVAFVKGTVSRAGLPLDERALLVEGDIIVTGSDGFLSIEFSSGSVVNLQPDTVATIVRLSCLERDSSCLIDIAAERGDLSSEVESRDGQPVEFRISTPFASAAVRGTVFETIVDPSAVRASVTEGEVEVSALGESVSLPTGFGSVTEEGSPPGEPRALLRSPVFRTTPIRVAPGDVVAWFELAGAVRYNALFSLDEERLQGVAELENEDTRLELGSGLLDAGDYHLTVRGVDDEALPGFTSTVRIGVVEIDETIEPVAVTITREGPEFLIEVVDPPEGAPGFEIQVGTDAALEDPLAIDVAAAGRAVIRLETDTLHARARTLVDPLTVSAFGPVASTDD